MSHILSEQEFQIYGVDLVSAPLVRPSRCRIFLIQVAVNFELEVIEYVDLLFIFG